MSGKEVKALNFLFPECHVYKAKILTTFTNNIEST